MAAPDALHAAWSSLRRSRGPGKRFAQQARRPPGWAGSMWRGALCCALACALLDMVHGHGKNPCTFTSHLSAHAGEHVQMHLKNLCVCCLCRKSAPIWRESGACLSSANPLQSGLCGKGEAAITTAATCFHCHHAFFLLLDCIHVLGPRLACTSQTAAGSAVVGFMGSP